MHHRAASLSASLLALFVSAGAVAEEPGASATERFNIKSQPLSTALRAYAEQTGEQVVFFSNIGRGRESAAVSGQYTRDQALQQLLHDTGLRYERLNTKTIAISEVKAEDGSNGKGERAKKADRASDSRAEPAVSFIRLAQAEAPGVQRASATPEASQPEQELFSMQEVVVTGTASRDRTKYDSSVAISTFDSKDIAQQAPKSTADLVSSVPGFWVESTAGTT